MRLLLLAGLLRLAGELGRLIGDSEGVELTTGTCHFTTIFYYDQPVQKDLCRLTPLNVTHQKLTDRRYQGRERPREPRQTTRCDISDIKISLATLW